MKAPPITSLKKQISSSIMKFILTSATLSWTTGLTFGLLSMAVVNGQETSNKQAGQGATYSEIKEAFPSAQNKGVGALGTQATIDLKNGLIFLDGKDGDKLLQSWGNLPTVMDGLVMSNDVNWVITFRFSSIGYVKDDEKEEIDADEILDQRREAQKESNKQRVKQGLGNLNIVRWVVEPRYNEKTNNLEWAMLLKDDDGIQTINYEIRLLGRRGVMNATLLCGPEQFESLKPVVQSALDGFVYSPGNQYGEYKEGDKIAEYGLLGLMGAGGVFVIWKFWKPIAAGVVALAAMAKKFFGGLFGGGSDGRIS